MVLLLLLFPLDYSLCLEKMHASFKFSFSWFGFSLYCTVLYCIVLYCIAQYCTVLYSTLLNLYQKYVVQSFWAIIEMYNVYCYFRQMMFMIFKTSYIDVYYYFYYFIICSLLLNHAFQIIGIFKFCYLSLFLPVYFVTSFQ